MNTQHDDLLEAAQESIRGAIDLARTGDASGAKNFMTAAAIALDKERLGRAEERAALLTAARESLAERFAECEIEAALRPPVGRHRITQRLLADTDPATVVAALVGLLRRREEEVRILSVRADGTGAEAMRATIVDALQAAARRRLRSYHEACADGRPKNVCNDLLSTHATLLTAERIAATSTILGNRGR